MQDYYKTSEKWKLLNEIHAEIDSKIIKETENEFENLNSYERLMLNKHIRARYGHTYSAHIPENNSHTNAN